MSTSYLFDPQPRVAFLRALALKIAGVARSLWVHTQLGLSAALRLPRTLAQTALGALSTSTGYTTVVSGIRAIVTTIGRVVGAAVRTAGRVLQGIGNAALRLIGRVSPTAENALRRTVQRVARPVRAALSWIAGFSVAVGQTVSLLARTSPVRKTATVTASVLGSLQAIHLATSGAAAAKVAALVPQASGVVSLLLNPWAALGIVGAATLTAMGVVLVRLLREPIEEVEVVEGDVVPDKQASDQPSEPELHTEEEAAADEPAGQAEEHESVDPLDGVDDLAEVARRLHVLVEPDGSIRVEGLPATWSEESRQAVAAIAADAAVGQLQRIVRTRKPTTRDDRRLLTKVAREAVTAEARRRKNGQQGMPFAA